MNMKVDLAGVTLDNPVMQLSPKELPISHGKAIRHQE